MKPRFHNQPKLQPSKNWKPVGEIFTSVLPCYLSPGMKCFV
jgi:hypothetical protein